jgi:hypothetical protein
MCSDEFAWGTADLEQITPENIHELERAIADVKAIDKDIGHAFILFAARQRKMRPQGAAYPKDKELWPLFDACGPKREVNMINPHRHPEDKDGTD